MKLETWFQNFIFKWVGLCRYGVELDRLKATATLATPAVGLVALFTSRYFAVKTHLTCKIHERPNMTPRSRQPWSENQHQAVWSK
jgi:hypothetical protein